jgi:hypothetical protein
LIKIHPAGDMDTWRQTDRDNEGNKHFLKPICLKIQQTIICGNKDTSLGQNDKYRKPRSRKIKNERTCSEKKLQCLYHKVKNTV